MKMAAQGNSEPGKLGMFKFDGCDRDGVQPARGRVNIGLAASCFARDCHVRAATLYVPSHSFDVPNWSPRSGGWDLPGYVLPSAITFPPNFTTVYLLGSCRWSPRRAGVCTESKIAAEEDSKMTERWQKDADGILIFVSCRSVYTVLRT